MRQIWGVVLDGEVSEVAPGVTKSHKPIYIYALHDPRTDEIRYIGGTKNPDSRVAQHMNSRGSSPKNRWFRELRSLGLEPILRVLEVADEATWRRREQYWIRKTPGLFNVPIERSEFRRRMRNFERELLECELAKHGGNAEGAARSLGLSLATFKKKMERHAS